MIKIELRPTENSLISMALQSLAARYAASNLGEIHAFHRWSERMKQRGPLVPTVHSGGFTYVYFPDHAMRCSAGKEPELVP